MVRYIPVIALLFLAAAGHAMALPGLTKTAVVAGSDLTITDADPPVAVFLKAVMAKDCATVENLLDDSFEWWGTDITATTNDAPLVSMYNKKQVVAMACDTAPAPTTMVLSPPSTWRATGAKGPMSMAFPSTILYAGPPLAGSTVNCTSMCSDTFVARVNASGKITSVLNTWDQVQYLTSAKRCQGTPVPVPSQDSSESTLVQGHAFIDMYLNGQCDAYGDFVATNLTKWQAGVPSMINKAADIAGCKQYFGGMSMWYIANHEQVSTLDFGHSFASNGAFGVTVTDPTTKLPCSIFSACRAAAAFKLRVRHFRVVGAVAEWRR